MAKLLRILIGDDAFEDLPQVYVTGILIAMMKMFGRKEPIEIKKESGWFVCNGEIGPFSPIMFKLVTTSSDLIAESREDYDWIVTDFNYGRNDPQGGLTVLSMIKNLKHPIKVCYTSTDNKNDIRLLATSGAMYIISTIGKDKDKFELLGEQIALHYLK